MRRLLLLAALAVVCGCSAEVATEETGEVEQAVLSHVTTFADPYYFIGDPGPGSAPSWLLSAGSNPVPLINDYTAPGTRDTYLFANYENPPRFSGSGLEGYHTFGFYLNTNDLTSKKSCYPAYHTIVPNTISVMVSMDARTDGGPAVAIGGFFSTPTAYIPLADKLVQAEQTYFWGTFIINPSTGQRFTPTDICHGSWTIALGHDQVPHGPGAGYTVKLSNVRVYVFFNQL
jgi:hypothetical protein